MIVKVKRNVKLVGTEFDCEWRIPFRKRHMSHETIHNFLIRAANQRLPVFFDWMNLNWQSWASIHLVLVNPRRKECHPMVDWWSCDASRKGWVPLYRTGGRWSCHERRFSIIICIISGAVDWDCIHSSSLVRDDSHWDFKNSRKIYILERLQ